MIEFEEPEAKYDFEVSGKGSSKVKIRVITMFVIFLMVILMLIKNDFSFNLLETSIAQVPEQCNPLYSYDPEDSYSSSVQSAKQILNENIMEFGRIEGFHKAFVLEEEPMEQKRKVPEIRVEFNKIPESEISFPDNLCGFKISVIYK